MPTWGLLKILDVLLKRLMISWTPCLSLIVNGEILVKKGLVLLWYCRLSQVHLFSHYQQNILHSIDTEINHGKYPSFHETKNAATPSALYVNSWIVVINGCLDPCHDFNVALDLLAEIAVSSSASGLSSFTASIPVVTGLPAVTEFSVVTLLIEWGCLNQPSLSPSY